MWCCNEDRAVILNDTQLELTICKSSKNIFLLDGPTMCGKTFFLKHLKADNVMISPFCIVIEKLIECLREKKPIDKFYDDMNHYFSCKILCLEDINITLAGKAITQKETASLLMKLSQTRKIILTGIQINERCGEMLCSLGANYYDCFRYD